MLDLDFVKEVLSIPSYTGSEDLVRDFILSWASKKGIKASTDDFGNVYLVKGTASEGEFYPCLTAHMDTVHASNKPFIEEGKMLEIVEKDGILWCEHGIGGDDKAGISIILTILDEIETAKACFFVQEEPGCVGSEHLNEDWFRDVGYTIAYDSPGYNRSAFACSGVMLFDKDFYENHVKPVFSGFGVTNFYSEPCTDIENIRIKVGIACVNISAGYYNQHTKSEFCNFEEMKKLEELGKSMISHLGFKRYDIPCSGKKYDFYDENFIYFTSLTSNSENGDAFDDKLGTDDIELSAYIINCLSYEVERKCKNNGIDFSLFEEIFVDYLNFITNGDEIHMDNESAYKLF